MSKCCRDCYMYCVSATGESGRGARGGGGGAPNSRHLVNVCVFKVHFVQVRLKIQKSWRQTHQRDAWRGPPGPFSNQRGRSLWHPALTTHATQTPAGPPSDERPGSVCCTAALQASQCEPLEAAVFGYVHGQRDEWLCCGSLNPATKQIFNSENAPTASLPMQQGLVLVSHASSFFLPRGL